MYAIRRADGEPMGDYSHLIVAGPHDWEPAEADSDYADEPITYELVKMDVEVVECRTLPRCKEGCGAVGTFWGLCQRHAEEDDPETVREMLAERDR